MTRNQKVLVLVIGIFLSIALISWALKSWGTVGVGIGAFIFGYFAGKKNA